MRDFNNNRGGGNRGGGNRFGGGGNRFGGRDGGDRQMHDATCANCGKDCKVPFRPTGDKPVYCNDCFRDQNGGDRNRVSGPRGDRSTFRSGGGDRAPRREEPSYQKQLDEMNKKLDLILKAVKTATQETEEVVAKPKKKVKKSKPAKAVEEISLTEAPEDEAEVSQDKE